MEEVIWSTNKKKIINNEEEEWEKLKTWRSSTGLCRLLSSIACGSRLQKLDNVQRAAAVTKQIRRGQTKNVLSWVRPECLFPPNPGLMSIAPDLQSAAPSRLWSPLFHIPVFPFLRVLSFISPSPCVSFILSFETLLELIPSLQSVKKKKRKKNMVLMLSCSSAIHFLRGCCVLWCVCVCLSRTKKNVSVKP